jgi:predicted DsbA family dithiol-disulfide isomerase
MQIEIWSDVLCPWCAVGKARLEEALVAFEGSDSVTLRWRSFELNPDAPAAIEGDYVALLASKYRRSRDEAQGMIDSMTQTAADCGLDFHFEGIRPGNSFDAHRLLHLAWDRDLQGAMKARLMRAYLTEGEAIGDPAVLARLAVEVGLDAAEVEAVLAGEGYGAAVRADEAQARTLGISGVPFFVFDGRYGVSGAQDPETLLRVLRQVQEG